MAIPTRGSVHHQIARAAEELGHELDTEPTYFEGNLSIVYNRNQICSAFLDTDHSSLVMLDDDVLPHPDAHRLVDWLSPEDPGRMGWDVVSAAVPIWNPQLWETPVFNAFKDNKPLSPSLGNWQEEPIEAHQVGTGLVAIRRSVVEQLSEGQSPFRDATVGSQYFSEDILFCEDARDAGFRIGCDFTLECDHWKNVSLRRVIDLLVGRQ